MIKRKLLITFTFVICIFTACNQEIDEALELADDNRLEMERVLEYFNNDPNPLKYEAAKFLISNMPYHYSLYSKDMDKYDSAYMSSAGEPIQFRDSVFGKLVDNIEFKDLNDVTDIRLLKSEDLIKIINDACDVWQASSWSKDYDKSIFFDYVLPYRLLNEQLSDWRETISSEYPTLKSKDIRSKRGMEFESEDAKISNSTIACTESASNGKMTILDEDISSVKFFIDSPIPSKKSIFLRYTTTVKNASVNILVNGKLICEKHLDPTNSMKVFRDSRIGIDINIHSGINEIEINHCNGTIGLDYIQFSTVETFDVSKSRDFSKNYYRIKNNATGNYIYIDSLNNNLPKDIMLQSANSTDSCAMIRLDYRGNGSWSISPSKNDSVNYCLEVKYCSLKENDPISIYNFLNGNHQKWIFIPIGHDLYKIMGKDSGLFLESVTDKEGNENLVQASYSGKDTQKWYMERCGYNSNPNSLYPFESSMAEALKIYDVTNQFEWFPFKGHIPPKASSLLTGRTGSCRDEANYTVYLCRYLGIPAAVDFTPNWGNRSNGHSWSVIIKPNGKSMPFYMGCVPGDTVHYYHGYIKPKIFRHGFKLNKEIAKDLKGERFVPRLFQNASFIDVTDEYYVTSDITRSIPLEKKGKKVAYICVFDNSNWIPVHYGIIKNGNVTFKSMGRNIVYMAATFEEGHIVPFGSPFLVKSDGEIKDIRADISTKQRMILLRKYPFMGKFDHFNIRMSGGCFQGSNIADFSDKKDLYTHDGLTNGNWYDVAIKDYGKYKYIRYIGPKGSYCNVNEIMFFTPDGINLDGEIIGTEGIAGKTKEKVFDGDILTGFEGVSPDGHWVGLKFRNPVQIGRIRYIPRNDGNCIEVGDEYELFYWHDNGWSSLGRKKATENQLIYSNVPSGGLYVIRNLSKGHEERIFTYENGSQIWW